MFTSFTLSIIYIYITYLILFLKDLSLYTLFLGQSRQIFSKKIVTSLLIKHLAFKIFVAKISVFDAKEYKMVRITGVIRKPTDVGEWPYWIERMDFLDGSAVEFNLVEMKTYTKICTGVDKEQQVVFLPCGVAINIMWVHEMEFMYG